MFSPAGIQSDAQLVPDWDSLLISLTRSGMLIISFSFSRSCGHHELPPHFMSWGAAGSYGSRAEETLGTDRHPGHEAE